MKAILALEDGKYFLGRSFTGQGEAHGEVIFNTSMAGYQDILADPAYLGQMVCMTYPLIGSYGINLDAEEDSRAHCPALIVKECCQEPSNWQAKESLPDFLTRQGIMGLEGIDTRALASHLREHGSLRGLISTQDKSPEDLVARLKAIPQPQAANLIATAGTRQPYIWTDAGSVPAQLDTNLPVWPATSTDRPRVLVYDFGMKWNILRALTTENITPLVVPPLFPVELTKKLSPDGILLSSGPGNPADLSQMIGPIQELSSIFPMAGIGLGYQLLAISLGATSFKLKRGHHGANYPVRDNGSGKIKITAQNHAYCVDLASVPDLELTHVNINDATAEGFCHRNRPIFGVQFFPAASTATAGSTFYSHFKHMLTSGQPR